MYLTILFVCWLLFNINATQIPVSLWSTSYVCVCILKMQKKGSEIEGTTGKLQSKTNIIQEVHKYIVECLLSNECGTWMC